MSGRHRDMRAWAGGKNLPPQELWQIIEGADPDPQILYDSSDEQERLYSEIFKRLYQKMDSLKRQPTEFRSWTLEDGIETFFATFIDFAPEDLRARVRILQQLGAFRFKKGASAEEKRTHIEAVFAEFLSHGFDHAANAGLDSAGEYQVAA